MDTKSSSTKRKYPSGYHHATSRNDNDRISNNNNINNDRDSEIELITIDGRAGEGGGQVLRNAIAYATILQKGLSITNIRGNRPNPGLQAQHLTSIQLAVDMYGGSILGNTKQSSTIQYTPAKSNDYQAIHTVTTIRSLIADTGTAGSICLLIQTALPCALFYKKQPLRINFKGGTNATMAPQYDYWERIFWPALQKQCRISSDCIEAYVHRRGFFPKGGGNVELIVNPLCTFNNITENNTLQPIHLTERGSVCTISIRSYHAGSFPYQVAQSMANTAKKYFQRKYEEKQRHFNGVKNNNQLSIEYQVEIVTERRAIGCGYGILIVAETDTGCLFGGSSLASIRDKNKSPDNVAVEACDELWETLEEDGCVDEWLQDQLIIFMTLASGQSTIITGSVTLHTQTAISVAEIMTGVKFTVTKLKDSNDSDPTAASPTKKISNTTDDAHTAYGKHGRINGKHRIECNGIGLRFK